MTRIIVLLSVTASLMFAGGAGATAIESKAAVRKYAAKVCRVPPSCSPGRSTCSCEVARRTGGPKPPATCVFGESRPSFSSLTGLGDGWPGACRVSLLDLSTLPRVARFGTVVGIPGATCRCFHGEYDFRGALHCAENGCR